MLAVVLVCDWNSGEKYMYGNMFGWNCLYCNYSLEDSKECKCFIQVMLQR